MDPERDALSELEMAYIESYTEEGKTTQLACAYVYIKRDEVLSVQLYCCFERATNCTHECTIAHWKQQYA
eukprot:2160800-Pyramimonas_sp.AAC.1